MPAFGPTDSSFSFESEPGDFVLGPPPALPGGKEDFGARSLPKLPERQIRALEDLHLAPDGSGFAWEYAAPFIKLINQLQEAIQTYPELDGFPKVNEALRNFPDYQSFLEEEVARGEHAFSASQRAKCAEDLLGFGHDKYTKILEDSCKKIRAIQFFPPHDPLSALNIEALGALFHEIGECFEIIKGPMVWRWENCALIVEELYYETAAALLKLSRTCRDS